MNDTRSAGVSMTRQMEDFLRLHWRRLVVVGLLVALIIIILGYVFGWAWVGMVEYEYARDGSRTGIAGVKTFWNWLELLLVPAVLAAAGLFITTTIAQRQRRVDATFDLASEYVNKSQLISDTASAFRQDEERLTATQRDRVRTMGDWWDVVATYINHGAADLDLLKALGMTRLMRSFYEKAKTKTFLQGNLPDWEQLAIYCETGGKNDGKES
jgi:hypothetical protein